MQEIRVLPAAGLSGVTLSSTRYPLVLEVVTARQPHPYIACKGDFLRCEATGPTPTQSDLHIEVAPPGWS